MQSGDPSNLSPQHAGATGWTTPAITACCLSDLAVGCRGCVVSIGGEDAEMRRRLLEMGFCNGACVEVVRRAPLRDPIEFRLRGYSVSMRKDQAKHVVVLPQL